MLIVDIFRTVCYTCLVVKTTDFKEEKQMKRKLALLLVLVIALGSVFMAACGGKEDDTDSKKESTSQTVNLKNISGGTWKFKLPVADILPEGTDESVKEMYADIEIEYHCEFDDGEAKMTVDTEKIRKDIETAVVEYYKKVNGEEPGEEALDQLSSALDMMVSALSAYQFESVYKIDGKKISFAQDEDDLEDPDEYMVCKVIDKNEIEITEWESASYEFPESLFPISLVRE